jgi:diaminohydroxyphosphoribosylaminopyrimidine deaminase/5-amino-6-(5-phosphoribosylamino)uracil reductase
LNLFSALGEIKETISDSSADTQSADEAVYLTPGDDEKFMARAIKLAQKGLFTCHPNPAVGCVIVNDNVIVGEGWHDFAGQPHAEINAIKAAGKRSAGATMYVTLEPCCHHGKTPPCTRAIIKSGIQRVVVAIEDPNPMVNRGGISELQRAGIDVLCGMCKSDARKLNRGFFKRISTGVPWVTLKTAISLDGKTAMQSGESQWITSEAARRDAHKLRAGSSAVLTGVGTVLRDDPSMTVRLDGVQRQPARIILDTNLSTPMDARIFDGKGTVYILTTDPEKDAMESYPAKGVEIINCISSAGRIDLHQVMKELGSREMNSVLLEAGPRLNGSMLECGLVDELVVYMSPDMLGSDARGMFSIPGIENLSDRVGMEFQGAVMVGRDLKLTLKPLAR